MTEEKEELNQITEGADHDDLEQNREKKLK